MLTLESLEEALPLTQSFDSRDIILKPVEDTPLGELVKQTVILPDDEKRGFSLQDSVEVTNVVEKAIDGSSHDLVMDEIVKVGSEAVRSHIHFARNVVAPKVAEYIQAIEEDIANLPLSRLNKFEIQRYQLPEVMGIDSFNQTLELFEDTPFEEPILKLNLKDQTDEELRALLHVGSGLIDDLIDGWVATVGMDFIRKVYCDVFQVKSHTDTDYSKVHSFRKFMDDKECGNDFTLASYLLANRLHDNPPEDTDHSLDEYNSIVLQVRNQAGNKLYRLLKEVQLAYTNQKLIRSYTADGKVCVYADVYEDFIANGGDNEIILGAVVAEDSYYTLPQIVQDTDKLRRIWESHKSIEERVSINNKFVYIKEKLFARFNEILNQEVEMDVAEKNVVVRIFKGELNLVRNYEFTNICDVCMKLLCRSLYYKTDAERILGSIDKISKENPSISVREAALISVIELTTDWVCSQIKPTSAY